MAQNTLDYIFKISILPHMGFAQESSIPEEILFFSRAAKSLADKKFENTLKISF